MVRKADKVAIVWSRNAEIDLPSGFWWLFYLVNPPFPWLGFSPMSKRGETLIYLLERSC